MKLLNVNNIKFNDYPDVKDITQPYVVLDDFDLSYTGITS